MLSAQELASMQATVTGSLDVSLPFYHKTVTQDGYGHSTETYPSQPSATYKVNVTKPSATQLQAYAGIIGAKEALILRYMPTSDIREGDRTVYGGHNWIVQYLLLADSYTVANDCLITAIE